MARDNQKSGKFHYYLAQGFTTFALDCLLVAIAGFPALAVPSELPKPRVPAPRPPAPVQVPVNRIPEPEPAQPPSRPSRSQNYDPLPVYNPPSYVRESPRQVVEVRSRPPIESGVVSCDEEGHIKAIRLIRYGEVVHCVLGDNSFRSNGRPMHIYQFQGKVNQPIVAKLIGGKPGDWQLSPYLVLLGPDREIVAADDNTSRQRVAQVNVKLPENGIYTILASNGDPKQTGRYSVVVERDPNLYSVDRLEELDNRSSRLSQDNSAYNISEFQGEQDRLVTIRASSYNFFPVVFLLDSDDRILASNENPIGDRNATIEYRLPQSGTYKVLVNSLRPTDRGTYRLTISSSSRLR
jgi:hypothetical protein